MDKESSMTGTEGTLSLRGDKKPKKGQSVKVKVMLNTTHGNTALVLVFLRHNHLLQAYTGYRL
jgi:hypothetical protein